MKQNLITELDEKHEEEKEVLEKAHKEQVEALEKTLKDTFDQQTTELKN